MRTRSYFFECTASALVGGALLCAWMLYALSGCGAPTPRDMASDAQQIGCCE